jgi:hypothetical protein
VDQSDRNPLPKTTPLKIDGLTHIKIYTKDGRVITVKVSNDQGFFRESEMKINGRTIQIQEVYITNGRVLKSRPK